MAGVEASKPVGRQANIYVMTIFLVLVFLLDQFPSDKREKRGPVHYAGISFIFEFENIRTKYEKYTHNPPHNPIKIIQNEK